MFRQNLPLGKDRMKQSIYWAVNAARTETVLFFLFPFFPLGAKCLLHFWPVTAICAVNWLCWSCHKQLWLSLFSIRLVRTKYKGNLIHRSTWLLSQQKSGIHHFFLMKTDKDSFVHTLFFGGWWCYLNWLNETIILQKLDTATLIKWERSGFAMHFCILEHN